MLLWPYKDIGSVITELKQMNCDNNYDLLIFSKKQAKFLQIKVYLVLVKYSSLFYQIFNTVLPRKERHAGISEGDHFHENGLMVLYRHAGINRGMLCREIFVLFLTLFYHSKLSNTYSVSF